MGKPRRTSSMKRWRVWAAFMKQKGILTYSKSQKGVMIAVRMHWDLVKCFDEVYSQEDSRPSELRSEHLNVGHWITRDSTRQDVSSLRPLCEY